jgi:hypothetical protein
LKSTDLAAVSPTLWAAADDYNAESINIEALQPRPHRLWRRWSSVYAAGPRPAGDGTPASAGVGPIDVTRISVAAVERIRTDPQFAQRVAAELDVAGADS